MSIEAAGKVTKGFFDIMKEQPLALALCVMNFALIGFLYVQSAAFNAQRESNVKIFVDVQREVQKLLSQCIVPPTQQRGGLPLDPEPPIRVVNPGGE